MKPSKYNYQVKITKDNEEYSAIYNTLYGSVLLLNSDIDISNLESIDDESRKLLTKSKFLIPDDLSEIDLIRSQNKIQRFNNLTLELTILPTRWCNLNCQYCFEDRKNINMSNEDIEAIYSLVLKSINNLNCISLLWFGGEPLLEIDKLNNLSRRIKNLAEEKNVEFKNSIITNGTLLTDNNCSQLLKSGIKYMQITLDGPPDVHNKRKPTIKGKNTFNQILNSIITCSKHFDLSVRVNIDNENKTSIKKLIDILASHDLQENIYIYIAKVESVTGACSNISGTCLKDEDFLNAEQDTLAYLKTMGFSKIAIPSYQLNYCTADNVHSLVLLPERKIHKCWHMVGVDNEVVGKLTRDGELKYNEKYYKWLAYDPIDDQKCQNCKLLPLCMGGCPKNKLIDNSQKCDFLENTIKNYIEKIVVDSLQ